MDEYTHYESANVTLYCGDALEVVRSMPSSSVDCVVTSPPYFGLRDYGIEGQYGHEPTPQGFAETLRDLFREVRRVLTDDGTVWLNLGDSYTKGKNLIGTPWRTALALQDDGWILRNDIIWHKPNAMPEPSQDRLARKHEHVFLLTKGKKYHFDLGAIREPHTCDRQRGRGPRSAGGTGRNDAAHATTNTQGHPDGKNPGDVWSINTRSFPEAHFATFPPDLARRCIAAGCPEGGTVLDPFSGAGTTGMAALEQGKTYIGVDLNPEYLDLSLQTRLSACEGA